MMKIKKVNFIRPEIEVKLCKPFISRLYLAFIFHRFVKVVRFKYTVNICSKIMKNAGHVTIKKAWYICIPKIKVVDSL